MVFYKDPLKFQHVDDSIIFSRATNTEMGHLLSILQRYEAASGQQVYLNESELSYSRNVPSTRSDKLERLMGVKVMETHEKYFGLPTRVER